MWNRVFEVRKESVGLDKVMDEIAVFTDLIDYVLSCLDDKYRYAVEQIISSSELGLLEKEMGGWCFFSNLVADFRGIPSSRPI